MFVFQINTALCSQFDKSVCIFRHSNLPHFTCHLPVEWNTFCYVGVSKSYCSRLRFVLLCPVAYQLSSFHRAGLVHFICSFVYTRPTLSSSVYRIKWLKIFCCYFSANRFNEYSVRVSTIETRKKVNKEVSTMAGL